MEYKEKGELIPVFHWAKLDHKHITETKWDWDAAIVSVVTEALVCSLCSIVVLPGPLLWHEICGSLQHNEKCRPPLFLLMYQVASPASWIFLKPNSNKSNCLADKTAPNPHVLNTRGSVWDLHFQLLWDSRLRQNPQLTLLEIISLLLFSLRPCHLDCCAISVAWSRWSNCP